jgi:hypothetical protein
MQWRWNSRCGALAVLILFAGSSAGAEDVEAPPDVSLDQLLHVPHDVDLSTPRRGGATRDEWRARFDAARAERAEAQAALEAAQKELEGIAAESSQWQMTAPGLGGAQAATSEKPLSYRLRQEIRRQREEIERADQRLQELRVQANLSGVPEDWIAEEPDPGDVVEPASDAGLDPAAGAR